MLQGSLGARRLSQNKQTRINTGRERSSAVCPHEGDVFKQNPWVGQVVTHTWDLSTWRLWQEGDVTQSHPELISEFKTGLGFDVEP